MIFDIRSYFLNVILNPLTFKSFKNENMMKNIPIYDINHLFKLNVSSDVCKASELNITIDRAITIGFLDVK